MNPVPIQLDESFCFAEKSFPIAVDGGARIGFEHLPRNKNYTFLPHCHDFLEIVMVTGGLATHYIDGKAAQVSNGDMFIIRPGVVHCFDDERELSIYNLSCNLNALELPFNMLRRIPGYNLLFGAEIDPRHAPEFTTRLSLSRGKFSHAVTLMEKLFYELVFHSPGFEAAVLAHLTEFLVFLGRNCRHDSGSNSSLLPRLGEAIARMENEYHRPLSIKELAECVCSSPRNFQRVFHQATGVSPLEYLNTIRLRRAAHLLRDRDLSILEVATSCGFRNASYFAKKFRKAFGITPLRFRQS